MLSRRDFLKALVAGGAVAAAAIGDVALGDPIGILRYGSSPSNQTVISQSNTENVTTFVKTTYRKLATLEGRVYFDRNMDGVQKDGEEGVPKARVLLKHKNNSQVVAESLADSSGDYVVNDIPVGNYKLHIEADTRFGYVCRSTSDISKIGDGHDVVVNDDLSVVLPNLAVRNLHDLTINKNALWSMPDGANFLVHNDSVVIMGDSSKVNFGLAEGILTMPFSSKTRYSIDRMYDHDPSGKILWWNGPHTITPDDQSPRSTNNHPGIDYGIEWGTPIISQAPGTVFRVYKGTGFAIIRHPVVLEDRYIASTVSHMSKFTAVEGQQLKRGDLIGYSGDTNGPYPHLHSGVITSTRDDKTLVALDQYKPIIDVPYGFWTIEVPYKWLTEYNPAYGINWWSVLDDPQFPF